MHILPVAHEDTQILNQFGIYRCSDKGFIGHVISCASTVAWLPVVGTIIGLAKIVFAIFIVKLAGDIDQLDKFLTFIGRACVETASLGFIFIIPDLAVTIIRSISQNIAEANPSEDYVVI